MVHDIASPCIAKKLWKTKMVWLSNAAASSGAFLWKGWVGTPAPRREGGSGWQKKFRGSSQPIRSHDFQILTNRKPQFKFLEGLSWHRLHEATSGFRTGGPCLDHTGTGRWLRKQKTFFLVNLLKGKMHWAFHGKTASIVSLFVLLSLTRNQCLFTRLPTKRIKIAYSTRLL